MTDLQARVYEQKRLIILFIENYLGAKIPKEDKGSTEGYRGTNYDAIPFEVIVPEPVHDLKFYKIITLNMILAIEACELTTFLNTIEDFTRAELKKLSDHIFNYKTRNYRYYPEVKLSSLQTDGSEYNDFPIGAKFNTADKKIEKLTNLIHTELEHISLSLTHSAKLFNNDDNKAKIYDVYIRPSTEDNGLNTQFHFFMTKRPAVANEETMSERLTGMMTDEDKKFYFGYPAKQKDKASSGVRVYHEIDAAFKRINAGIHDLLTNYLNEEEEVNAYLSKVVNHHLIPSLCSVNLEPYSFFFGNGKLIDEEETENTNTKVCSEILDKEITKLFTHLENLPIAEGSQIDHYSIDIDSLGIYGRDAQHNVIEAMVKPEAMFETVFGSHYSDSFLELFKHYLKTVKNKFVFSQLTAITPKEAVEEIE